MRHSNWEFTQLLGRSKNLTVVEDMRFSEWNDVDARTFPHVWGASYIS
jgi:hypothetical protein